MRFYFQVTKRNSANPPLHVAFFISEYGSGGVERMLVNSARGLAGRGHTVDYLSPASGPFLDLLGKQVTRYPLRAAKSKARLDELVRYLAAKQPDALLVGKDADGKLALRARTRVGGRTKIVFRPGTTVSRKVQDRNFITRWRTYRDLRTMYTRADGIVANSEGVRLDTARLTGIPAEEIFLVRNPVITPDFGELAAAEVEHPWFADGQPPIIMGIGALRRSKDFATLLRAFRELRKETQARLLILGRGHQRKNLLREAQELGINEDVQLLGFVDNPYALLKRASLFVLSSQWEGSPNVLTEALALGVPSVATNCPSGPWEIMAGGRYGSLVPVGDSSAMADAMLRTLERPLPSDFLKEAVTEYTMERNAVGYELMLNAIINKG